MVMWFSESVRGIGWGMSSLIFNLVSVISSQMAGFVVCGMCDVGSVIRVEFET